MQDPRSPFLRPRTRNHLDSGGNEFAGYPGSNPGAIEVRIAPLTRGVGDQNLVGGVGGTTFEFTVNSQPPTMLLNNLRGFRLINVAGVVLMDWNGSGYNTVIDRDTWDFIKVTSLRFNLAAGATMTIQQWGE
jgi:hypothetical protein